MITTAVVCLCILTLLAFCWTIAFLSPPDQGEHRLERLVRAYEKGREHWR